MGYSHNCWCVGRCGGGGRNSGTRGSVMAHKIAIVVPFRMVRVMVGMVSVYRGKCKCDGGSTGNCGNMTSVAVATGVGGGGDSERCDDDGGGDSERCDGDGGGRSDARPGFQITVAEVRLAAVIILIDVVLCSCLLPRHGALCFASVLWVVCCVVFGCAVLYSALSCHVLCCAVFCCIMYSVIAVH